MRRRLNLVLIGATAWLGAVQPSWAQGTIACYRPDTPIALWLPPDTFDMRRTQPMDLDGDASPELTFTYSVVFLGVRSEGADRILLRNSPPPNIAGPVAPLPAGFEIGPENGNGGLQWYPRSELDPFETLIACYDVGCAGDFRGQHAYMGVEFQHAGGTNYGWVLLTIAPDYPAGQIEAWAWETRPGQPIVAGAGLDSDHDGVWDYLDQCPNTPPGEVVDTNGCSICQLCPCNGPWKNHGEYVKAVESVSARFVREGRITEQQRAAIVKQAASSDCGKHR